VAYKIEVYPEAGMQVKAMPRWARVAYPEAISVLELVPWNGLPYREDYPDGPMRQLIFGPSSEGLLTYLILEGQHRVDVLRVQWLG
jgi:hypothetical protein